MSFFFQLENHLFFQISLNCFYNRKKQHDQFERNISAFVEHRFKQCKSASNLIAAKKKIEKFHFNFFTSILLLIQLNF
jgi:hypothetical protein